MFRALSFPLSIGIFLLTGLLFAERLHIKADRFLTKGDKAIYEGNVVLTTDKGRKLLCDRLIIFLGKDGKVKLVKALGHIYYEDSSYRATGDNATYLPFEAKLFLEGNAVVSSKDGVLKGDKIVYHLKSKDMEVKSRSRVESVLDVDTP